MHAYAEKAMREAATSTTWTSPDEAFEAAVHAVVDAAYDRADVHEPLAAFVEPHHARTAGATRWARSWSS